MKPKAELRDWKLNPTRNTLHGFLYGHKNTNIVDGTPIEITYKDLIKDKDYFLCRTFDATYIAYYREERKHG